MSDLILRNRSPAHAMMAVMISPPAQVDGKFSEFFALHVEPNLPSAERVQAFDALLRRHLSGNDPVYVTRCVRGQERGTICTTRNGGRILPTDNAPVWWLHAYLLSGEPFPADSEALLSGLPRHFHQAARFRTLNQAGYHSAHILSAKNRDIDWRSWSRAELVRRMMVNLHPCNVFLAAKRLWARNGGRTDIIAWVIEAHRRRYGEIMDRFLVACDADCLFGRDAGDPFMPMGKCLGLATSSRQSAQ